MVVKAFSLHLDDQVLRAYAMVSEMHCFRRQREFKVLDCFKMLHVPRIEFYEGSLKDVDK